MEHNDNVTVTESVHAHVTRQAETNPTFVKVRVLVESGIIKNGMRYPKDSEAVINAKTADAFAAIGEVEIIGPAEAPTQGQTNAE